MNREKFRASLEAWWVAADRSDREAKISNLITVRLARLYRELDPKLRAVADQVIGDWVTSDNAGKRFDAIALIEEYQIKSAVSSLAVLANTIQDDTTAEARYELKKVRSLIERLSSS